MALGNTQNLTIDLNNIKGFKPIKMKQYDKNTRKIDIIITDGDEIFTIPETVIAKFQATKPDKTLVFNDCTITNNIISFTPREQLSTVAGTVECEIGLYEPDTNGDSTKDKLLQSATFQIFVEKSAMDRNAIVSSDDFNTLTIMINSITGISADATEAIANINTAISNAETAIDNANTATINANDATSSANIATMNANTATTNANNATNLATTAANTANTSASNADTATTNANQAITDLNNLNQTVTNQESTRQTQETVRQNYYNAYKICEPYVGTTSYVVGNKVTYQGSTYQNILNCTGVLPTNTTNWILIAAKGTDGAGGDMFKSVYDPTNKAADIFAHDTKDDTVTFVEATVEADIVSGETHTTLFGKILKSFKSIMSKIGDLTQLQTTSNTNLVGGINENKGRIDTNNVESTGYGVISGLTVTAQTTPNMTVNVSTGIVHMPNGVRMTPIANSALTITTSDITYPRLDIVYVNSNGAISYLAGTASATPTAPSVPVGGLLLAEILVIANATVINSSDISDKRLIKVNNNELASQLADKVNNDKIDLTYYKNNGDNLVTVIQQKIIEGYCHFIVPKGAQFNETLHILDLAIANNGGILFEGSGSIDDDIKLNTGGIGIRVSGSTDVRFKNISLSSVGMITPSTIGVLYERSANKDVCQWNHLDNVYIRMHHDATANGGVGTIGLYNDTAELCEYNNLTAYADVPVVISRDDILNIGVTKRSLSMKCVAFTGITTLIAMKGNALILDAVSDFSFENLYCTKDLFTDYANNLEQYAIKITGTAASGYENYCINIANLDVEQFKSSFNINAKMKALTVVGNHQTPVDQIIKLAGSSAQLINSYFKIQHVNTPVAGYINYIDIESTALGCINTEFHLTSATQRVNTAKPLENCVIRTTAYPKVVKSHASTQHYYHYSDRGLGVNNNTIDFSYNDPTTPTADQEGEGSVKFNQQLGGVSGRHVGWIYNGSSYVKFGQVGYRTSTASPVGGFTPYQIGEELLDTTNKHWYKAVGTTSADWKLITI